MTLFRLDASIREQGSHSRRIADIVQSEWDAAYPDELVIGRELAAEPAAGGRVVGRGDGVAQ